MIRAISAVNKIPASTASVADFTIRYSTVNINMDNWVN